MGEEKQPAHFPLSSQQMSEPVSMQFPFIAAPNTLAISDSTEHLRQVPPCQCLSRRSRLPLGSPPANHGISQFPNVRHTTVESPILLLAS
jgi:hypothetical protein